MTLAHGFMSAGEPVAHFGLGQADQVRRLTVHWPSGHIQSFENLPVDFAYTVREPTGSPPPPVAPPTPSTLFVKSSALSAIKHEAEPYDDFKRQPLLPWKLSTLGPGMAWGDVDGDGTEEMCLSGNPTRPGGLYRRAPQGAFTRDTRSGLTSVGEEMAPLFFEANGDGFPDLLVVSGGAACAPGDTQLQDWLYLNDGKGHFTHAPAEAWPDLRECGSTAVAADYDRDGDLDLFVGARLIPGQYPLTPNSHLLRNDQGRFSEVTDAVAPGLKRAGLVTGALWSDVDNDGWLDLLVTCEWGPVRYFHQEQGRLLERTREAGLADRLGWWNGIAAGDLNHDGAIDYVVTNFGLNTRYQPTAARPCRLYHGDFGGNGESQLIEAFVTPEGIWPLRGKTALEQAVPRLAEAFPTHRRFAAAPLTDLLGQDALDRAYKLEVNTIESAALINDGRGRFVFRPLPRLAQVAPAFGVVVIEVNGDGKPDLCLVQNFHAPQRETGRMDGGVGLVALGVGDGTFEPVWPAESGFVVPGDARSLAVTDLNNDGWPDLAVGLHNGETLAFQNAGISSNRVFNVRLLGRASNPTAIGARVALRLKSGEMRTAEVHAGGGYLSQSTAILTFGLGPTDQAESVQVRWADGATSLHAVSASSASVRLRREP